VHGYISFGALCSGLQPYIDIFVYVCVFCVCVTVAIDVHWHQETKGPKAEDKLTRSAKISKQDKVHLLCYGLLHQFLHFSNSPKN
jgi:fatty acid desaturase